VKGLSRTKSIHLNRVVNDQLNRLEWINAAGISTQFGHGVPHGGQIHHCRHTSKVLEQDSRWGEGDLASGWHARRPAGQRLDILARDRNAVLSPQQSFKEYAQRVRQAAHV
jgi:hypothetical protein